MVERFGPLGLALRMTIRAPLKFAAVFLLVTAIAFLLAGVILLRTGVEEAMTKGAKRLGADLMVVPAGVHIPLAAGLIGGVPVHFSLPAGIEAAVAALPGIRMIAPQYFLSSAEASCCETGNMLLVGFDPANDFTVRPWLQSGDGKMPESEDVLIGGGIMKAKGAGLRLYNRTFRVAARLEKTGLGYFDNAVFIPLKGVAAMERSAGSAGAVPLSVSWGHPSLLLVQLDPLATVRETAALLERSNSAVRVVTIPDLFREKREKMIRIAAVQRPLVAAAWLFALAAGGAVQLLYWRERRPTLGLLQSLGFGKGAILSLFGLETLLLSLTGMVVGSVGAFLLLRLFAPYCAVVLGLPLLLGAGSVAVAGIPWLWLVFAGAMAAETFIILLCMLRREPAELMRCG